MKTHVWRLFLLSPFLALLLTYGQVNTVQQIAPDVYFHQGDLEGRGHCNNGWVILEDYVLVIDANFPSGASELIPKIRAISSKPVRFVFDTHHHGDHAYGNQLWAENGAVPVAHSGVVEEMKKYEAGYFGGSAGRWENAAEERPDVAASKLKLPTLLFNTDLIFDDGDHRVEALHFGVAHTHGDGFVWLPNERILFTGDAAVNGPHNYVGDGNVNQWIETLEKAKRLQPRIVCPGHGPWGGPEILEDQQNFFLALRSEVQELIDAGRTPEEARAAVESIRASVRQQERIARYVGENLAAQVEKVYVELGGRPFASAGAAALARAQHAQAHGHGR